MQGFLSGVHLFTSEPTDSGYEIADQTDRLYSTNTKQYNPAQHMKTNKKVLKSIVAKLHKFMYIRDAS